jgi:hypothetical protein
MRPSNRVCGNAGRTAAMIRLLAQPIRHRLLIATTAASAVVLLLIGLGYGSRVLSPETAVRQPAPATGSTGCASGNQLELSVFDQPHALPEVRFQDDQGRDLTLGDFRGRMVVLNVWATWCVPCRKEMPTLDRLQDQRRIASCRYKWRGGRPARVEKTTACCASMRS